jgi:hypothetical protein
MKEESTIHLKVRPVACKFGGIDNKIETCTATGAKIFGQPVASVRSFSPVFQKPALSPTISILSSH